MKNFILFATCAMLLLINQVGYAQADPLYRQNQTNAIMLNPAQAGANQFNEVNLTGQSTWAGFEGAPKTFAASANFKLDKGLGIAATAFTDQTGPVNHTNLGFNIAKHLKINKDWKLAVGLKTSISSLNVDLISLNTTVANDPLMQRQLSSGIRFDVAMGLLAHSENFYFGISQPRLMNINYFDVDMTNYVEAKGFVSYFGHNHKINDSYSIRSFVMYRHIPGNRLFLDFASTITLRDKIDLGLIYQFKSTTGIFAGININDNLYFGYTYSLPTSRIILASVQSHEFVLRFRFNQKNNSRAYTGARFFN